MFNVRDNKWEPGFRIGLTDAPSRREMVDHAPLENPYFPGLAGMSERMGVRIPSLPSIDPLVFPLWPSDDNTDDGIQPVRKPIKCSGPNSRCSLPLRIRANGIFRDPKYPQFLLCMPCYVSAHGRRPSGEDT